MTSRPSLSAESLMRVLEVARQLAAPMGLRELLEQVIEAGRTVLDADRGTVFLHDAERRELFSVVATGESEIRFSVDRGIAGRCARRLETINVPDCRADPDFNSEVDRRTGYETRCLIAVPLIGLDEQLVGVMQLLNARHGTFNEDDERLADVLAAQAAAAIQRHQLLAEREEKMRLEQEMATARALQQAVLPRNLPQPQGHRLVAESRPAHETGGDIYDAFRLPDEIEGDDKVLIMIADASGHGLGPALSVTQFRAMVRTAAAFDPDPAAIGRHVNTRILADQPEGGFVTALIGVLEPGPGRLRYHAFGQGPLWHYHAATGALESRHASSPPLGIVDPLPADDAAAFDLAAGDRIVVLTDGFAEAFAPNGEPFSNQRIAGLVHEHAAQPPETLIERLYEAVDAFTESPGAGDDRTGLILDRSAD